LFEGKKELFEGLWLAKHGDWTWHEYPVITIDFNGISHDTPDNLDLSLGGTLLTIAERYQIQLRKSLLKDKFKELIIALHQKTNLRVVILIDEYDKPLVDHLGQGEQAIKIAKTNRNILKTFFWY
jgi:hypothetical protein